ncbi:MAG: 50S ribosomal protein L15 [Leptospiraceae bacterium]|nr:50S ribosomal protein L15 [Leptospiraceae bacterium]MCK6380148.1 50S ribosomal protein L15 [Leptospiraceae bacterium]NUM42899.1 50S ribosomal protein L15 [Leptospiraceae bacterium]
MPGIKDRIKQSFAFGKKRGEVEKKLNTSNLIPVPKGAKRERKRIGQGPGSGMGKTSTRGQKGQKARASSMKRGFEGGQMPIHKRLPKRGFTSIFHNSYQAINLRDIARLNLTGEVDPKIMVKQGLIKEESGLVKLLGTGSITSPVKITVDKCSKSALEKVQKSGGSVQFRKKLTFPKKAKK